MKQIIVFFYTFYNFFMRYPTPPNLGSTWNFGVAALLFFAIQFVTGIFLSMSYVANADLAFVSVENIMRNVNYGWLLRYLHSNGASFFFFCVYLHTFRNLYYASFNRPRQNVWNIGVILLLLMILTAFTGYVLPWGQMSFWAATVITNSASAIPIFGDYIVIWLWGGFAVNTATLNRFFSFHFLLPFVMLFFIALHVIFLHERGSSNSISLPYLVDKMFFHPFFTSKDLSFLFIVVAVYLFFVGFYPNYFGHPDNYIPADPLLTPPHIVPEWYFSPFYAILRSIPSKLLGVLLLLLSIVVLFIFPLLVDYNKKVKDDVFPSWYPYFNSNSFLVKILLLLWRNQTAVKFWFFVVVCVLLGIMGGKSMDYPYLLFSRLLVGCYFIYFIMIINIKFGRYSNEMKAIWSDLFQLFIGPYKIGGSFILKFLKKCFKFFYRLYRRKLRPLYRRKLRPLYKKKLLPFFNWINLKIIQALFFELDFIFQHVKADLKKLYNFVIFPLFNYLKIIIFDLMMYLDKKIRSFFKRKKSKED